MRKSDFIWSCLALFMGSIATLHAQQNLPDNAAPIIVTPQKQHISSSERILCYDIPSNISYEVSDDASWITTKTMGNRLYVYAEQNYASGERTATITLQNTTEGVTKNIQITQGPDNSASEAPSIDYEEYNVFADKALSKLREDVTLEDIQRLSNPFIKSLATQMYEGTYETAYRIGEYEAYETVRTLAERLKTGEYNKYENPTGIFFEEGATKAVIVDGADSKYPIQLTIKDFGGSGNQEESKFTLQNGVNIIKAKHRGNAYISYYTDSYASAPNIRVHIAMGTINGYFDLERGDNNEDWKKLLANATSDIIDVRTKYCQVAFPTERFRKVCPNNGVEMAKNIDSTVYYSRDIMGLHHYNINPKNRQLARVVWSGFMFADGYGAAVNDNSCEAWMRPSANNFEFWGLAHELGHNNQITPGLKWKGTGETTNNIYSAWVQFKLGPGWYRLESEASGQNDYSHMKGGRFNCYLEEGVRKGNPWQTQKGPDYGWPSEKFTIKNEDYNGKTLNKDTTVVSGNFDHFVKLAPLWQIQLYCHQAGFSPNVYAKVCQSIRSFNYDGMSNGQIQMRFMKIVCDSTRLNFLPFFEKAGMLRPINYYVQDYGNGWLKINEEMINELKQHVEKQGYPMPKGEVNYITALNWETYAKQLPISGTLNSGCSRNGNYVQVNHSTWKNVVAFETYNSKDELIRISMQGLGGPENSNTYTRVLWPTAESPAYIIAVGWDGTRMKCYQP